MDYGWNSWGTCGAYFLAGEVRSDIVIASVVIATLMFIVYPAAEPFQCRFCLLFHHNRFWLCQIKTTFQINSISEIGIQFLVCKFQRLAKQCMKQWAWQRLLTMSSSIMMIFFRTTSISTPKEWWWYSLLTYKRSKNIRLLSCGSKLRLPNRTQAVSLNINKRAFWDDTLLTILIWVSMYCSTMEGPWKYTTLLSVARMTSRYLGSP